jgi:hypothetical protein
MKNMKWVVAMRGANTGAMRAGSGFGWLLATDSWPPAVKFFFGLTPAKPAIF